jgi:hypothetical protein
LSEVGGICVSGRVKEDAQGSLGRLGVAFEDLAHSIHLTKVARV